MNNILKRSIFYLIYVILIGFISIVGGQLNNYLFTLHATTFSSLYFWFLPIYPILIGLLIALPQFITNARMPGSWRFDWAKFIIVGIPALYVTFTHNFTNHLKLICRIFNIVRTRHQLISILKTR